jgi:soluble cytochrome b562
MSSSGNKTRKEAVVAKNKLHYEITAKDRSKQAMRSVQKGLRTVNKAANLLKTAIGGIALGLAVRSLARFTNNAIKAADAIAKTADKVGVGVVALQKLRFAADLAGVGQEKLDSSLERFTKRIGEAAQGTGDAKKALGFLGVEFADAEGKIRPTEAVLSAVADAMASVESPAQRAALAAQLFGREGVGLVLLLKGGSAGLREFGAQAEAAGAILSEDLARAAEVLNDKLTVSNRALDNAKIKIGLAFAQSGIIDLFTRAVQKLARVMSDQRFIKKFKDGINTIVNVLKFLGRNLENISTGLLIVFGYAVIIRIGKTARAIWLFTRALLTVSAITALFATFAGRLGKILGALTAVFAGAAVAVPNFGKMIKKAADDLKKFTGIGNLVKDKMKDLGKALGFAEDNFEELAASARMAAEHFQHIDYQISNVKPKIEGLSGSVNDLKEGMDDLGLSALKAFGSGAVAGAKEYFDGIRDHAAIAKDFVIGSFKALEKTLSDFFVSGEISFKSFIDTVKRGLADIAAKGVISFAGGVAETLLGGIGRKVGSWLGFASGGYVSGPGSDRSDNIPAMLSPGEYVVNAASVRKYGAGFFGALNSNSRGAVDTDSGLPGFGFGSFIRKAFKSVTGFLKKGVRFVVSGITGTLEGLASGDPMAIASVISSFILPGVMDAIKGAMSAASAAVAFGGVMSASGLSVAASLSGMASSGIRALATSISSGISNSFAQGIMGGQFSASAVAKALVGGGIGDLASAAVSGALGGGVDLSGALRGLFDSSGGDFSRAIAAAFGRVKTEAEPFLDRRARGGPVSSGHAYMVGERGPEVFTPGRAGSVSPSMNASQIVDAVHEVRDEMSALRRQFGRALSGGELAGARA